MPSVEQYRPFELPAGFLPPVPVNGHQIVHLAMNGKQGKQGKPGKPAKDRGAKWLRNAMIALGILAAVAAVVSYSAQYQLVYRFKHFVYVAALQAGIPDVGALVFASLGIALALQGKRAIRPRALNVVCVGISIGMNALAASSGWRAMAVWVMAPAIYALASDTLIGVVRAWTLARQRELRDLADDEATPLAIVGGLFLWLLRLTLAPASTLTGFRGWVVEECPTAPGRRQVAGEQITAKPVAAIAGPRLIVSPPTSGKARLVTGPRGNSKTAQFAALVKAEHGELAAIDPAHVSRICTELAPRVDLATGAARSWLRPRVLAARDAAGNAVQS